MRAIRGLYRFTVQHLKTRGVTTHRDAMRKHPGNQHSISYASNFTTALSEQQRSQATQPIVLKCIERTLVT